MGKYDSLKKSIILICSTLILLTGCNPYKTLTPEDVESVMIWTHESQRDMTENEISEFLQKYNSSEYGGKATGEGGTPDFGIFILLNDGKEIRVNDFYGKVEVYADNKSFYLENAKLYELLKRISGSSLDETP